MSGIVFKLSDLLEHLIMMGKNSRWPTKSNHGARPCSSVMRRMRKKGFYLRPRNENTAGVDGGTDDDELYADEGETEETKAEGAEGAEPSKEQTDTKGGKTDGKAPTKGKIDDDDDKPPAKQTKPKK